MGRESRLPLKSFYAATSRFQDVDSIKINKNFMRELEAALVEKRDAMVAE